VRRGAHRPRDMACGRVAIAALSACALAAATPTPAAENASMVVRAAPLAGPLARLYTTQDAPCPPDAAASREPQVIAELTDGRRFRVTLAGTSVLLRPIPPCEVSRDATRTALLPGTLPQRGSGALREAWLAEPTSRYHHEIFVQPENAAAIRVLTANGRVLRYAAPPDAVIEDRLPRLVHAWNTDAVLTVQSSTEGGAAVLLLAVRGERLQPLAESAPIGQARRWLNPIGVADFTGSGIPEVVAVVTPHIGGWLTRFRRDGERLLPVEKVPGFSNHAIGTDELRLAAMLDANADGVVDLAVPGAERRTLRLVTFAGGRFRELQRIGHSAPIRSAVIAQDVDGDGRKELVYALADGLLVVLAAPR
jgi:hypothetical protein